MVNAGWLIGIGISLFIAPPATPFWLWATISLVVFVGMNYVFFGRKQRKTIGQGGKRALPTAIGFMGVAVLLLEVILRYFHR